MVDKEINMCYSKIVVTVQMYTKVMKIVWSISKGNISGNVGDKKKWKVEMIKISRW